MTVKAIKGYTDTELGDIDANQIYSVKRERGLKLINSGFARLVSDDDVMPDYESLLIEKDAEIKRIMQLLAENGIETGLTKPTSRKKTAE